MKITNETLATQLNHEVFELLQKPIAKEQLTAIYEAAKTYID